MSKTRQLRDVYRFPGFEPLSSLHGVFGDPYAVVVTLRRRRKKRSVDPAARRSPSFTISDLAESVICRAATNASSSPSRSGASCAGGAAA
jgi:hypothetical protein